MSTTATTTANWGPAAPHAARLRRSRPIGVAAATLAAVAAWVIVVPGLGVVLRIRFGHAAPGTVGVDFVVTAALAGSLLGWGLLALLERHTERAHTIWACAAGVVLLASLSLPLTAATTTSATVALVMMHLTVAAVLIPWLLRHAPGAGARS